MSSTRLFQVTVRTRSVSGGTFTNYYAAQSFEALVEALKHEAVLSIKTVTDHLRVVK